MNWSWQLCTWKTSNVQTKCQGPLQLLSPPFLSATVYINCTLTRQWYLTSRRALNRENTPDKGKKQWWSGNPNHTQRFCLDHSQQIIHYALHVLTPLVGWQEGHTAGTNSSFTTTQWFFRRPSRDPASPGADVGKRPVKWKSAQRRRKHYALVVVRRSQKFSPRRRPPSWERRTAKI